MITKEQQQKLQAFWEQLETIHWDMHSEKENIEFSAAKDTRDLTERQEELWQYYDDAFDTIEKLMERIEELIEED